MKLEEVTIVGTFGLPETKTEQEKVDKGRKFNTCRIIYLV